MAFEVGVVARFTARHHLVGDFGPASQPHGHTYRVEASASGASLGDDGALFDITLLQRALGEALRDIEGRDLNTVPRLATPNPTAEIVARYLFDGVAPALSNLGITTLRVSVWESDEAYAAYAATPG
ncbi:MAG TPA: 6-carboxytetrahydropterin synthase [Chloroflexota bacterium]